MTPIYERWLAFRRNLPDDLNTKALRILKWAFYTGAASALTELRPRESAEADRLMRRTIRRELDAYAAEFEEELEKQIGERLEKESCQ